MGGCLSSVVIRVKAPLFFLVLAEVSIMTLISGYPFQVALFSHRYEGPGLIVYCASDTFSRVLIRGYHYD